MLTEVRADPDSESHMLAQHTSLSLLIADLHLCQSSDGQQWPIACRLGRLPGHRRPDCPQSLHRHPAGLVGHHPHHRLVGHPACTSSEAPCSVGLSLNAHAPPWSGWLLIRSSTPCGRSLARHSLHKRTVMSEGQVHIEFRPGPAEKALTGLLGNGMECVQEPIYCSRGS